MADSLYCRFDDAAGFDEYYDMTGAHGAGSRDVARWQLKNEVASLRTAELAALRAQLDQLRRCAGPTCHR